MKKCKWSALLSLILFVELSFNQTPKCSNSDKYSKGFAKIYEDSSL